MSSQKRRHQEEADAPGGPPRQKRQFTEKDRKRASVFEQLADDKHGTRIQAAKTLIEEFAPSNSPEVEKLKNVIIRLVNGLCSGRKSARAGYFIALSELLRQTASSNELFEQVTGGLEELLKLINRLTKPDRNAPQENRDKHIGRVAGYKAFLQSSILTNAKSASDENWDFFIAQTAKQAQSNPWLREECGSMLCDFITDSAKVAPSQENIVKKIVDKYSSESLLETAEGVAIWLTTQTAYPDLKLPKDIWHKRDPLHSTERTRLARILCDSRGSTEAAPGQKSKVKASGTWKPQPNFAWRVVLQQAFAKYSTLPKLRQFCIEILDNSLFADKASSERKLWGFSLVAWAIRVAPVELLPAFFTPNFMRTLTNHRADPSRELFHAAEGPLEAIAARGEKDAPAALKLFDFLVSSDASTQFDTITKSNTLSKLTGNVPGDGKKSMVDAIRAAIIAPATDENSLLETAHKSRVVLANLLVSMVARHAKHQDSVDDAFTKQIFETLSSFAYLKTKDASPSVSEDSRSNFHDAIIRATNHVLPKLTAPGSWLADLVTSVQKTGKSSASPLVLEADDTILESVATSHATLKALRKSLNSTADAEQEPIKILQLLFSLTLLEAYSGDPDAIDMLSELQTCHASISEQETKSQAFDLLVELLLSFLSKTSSLYRQLGDFIFPALSQGMSGDGLNSLLDILATKESAAGQGELFDAADAEEEDDEDDDDDGISIDSDVEILSPSEDEVDGDDEGNAEFGAQDSGDDEEDPELTQFNEMLAETLKTSGAGNTAGGDDSSDDQSDMDDDQMMALDPQLTKIFQERRKAAGLGDSGSKKKEKSKARLQVTLFKSRVLDLLQIYVKKQHAEPLSFKVLVPLLALMRTTSNSELEKKAKTTLGSWFENCDRNKEYPVAADVDETWALLREVHDEVQRPGSKQHTMICGRASLFIAKLLMLEDRSNMRRLVEEYGKTHLEVIENGTNVQPAFFTEWIGWCMQWKKGSGKHEKEVESAARTLDDAPDRDLVPMTGTSEHEAQSVPENKAQKVTGKSKKKAKKHKTNGITP